MGPTSGIRGGQLNAALVLEVENFTNWKKRFMCHIIGNEPQFENIIKNGLFIPMVAGQRKPGGQWTADERMDDVILYHEGPYDVKESRVMDLKLCYNTFKFKEGEKLTQTFTRYKALMNELVNDGIKLSMLEINIGFINRLSKKWLSFCQSLRYTNHVKDSELASLFGKLKYEENLIDNIYETEKTKYLVFATPLSTAFFSTSIVQDFQASKASMVKNKGLIAEAYEWDEEKVSSNDNEMVEVKVLMALAKDNEAVSKEGASTRERV
ncbi:hypothetical protein Tco_1162203, partial [Tanacetum coccineum]